MLRAIRPQVIPQAPAATPKCPYSRETSIRLMPSPDADRPRSIPRPIDPPEVRGVHVRAGEHQDTGRDNANEGHYRKEFGRKEKAHDRVGQCQQQYERPSRGPRQWCGRRTRRDRRVLLPLPAARGSNGANTALDIISRFNISPLATANNPTSERAARRPEPAHRPSHRAPIRSWRHKISARTCARQRSWNRRGAPIRARRAFSGPGCTG